MLPCPSSLAAAARSWPARPTHHCVSGAPPVCSAQLRSERLKRGELEARLTSVFENNKALAKQNTLLLKQTDRLRVEAELLQHQLSSCSAAFKAREAGSACSVSLLQQQVEELGLQLHAKEVRVGVLQEVHVGGVCAAVGVWVSTVSTKHCCAPAALQQVFSEAHRVDAVMASTLGLS